MNKEKSSLRECLERLGLKKDPFTEIISPEKFWFGPDDYLKSISWYIDNIDEKQKANLLLIGDYGTGKTFTLERIRYLIESDIPSLIPIYLKMEHPEKGFRSLYQFFMLGIGENRLVSIINQTKENAKTTKSKDFLNHLRTFLATDAVCKAITKIAFNEEEDEALSWIFGTGGYWEARKLGLDIYAANYKHALSMMIDVIRFLSHGGKGVAILLDEMENLVGVSRRVQEVREGLRDLYDEIVYGDIGKVMLIAACTAETYFELSEHLGEAFRDRIDEEIRVPQMTDEMAKSYLSDLLAWAKDMPPSEQKSFKPFENDAALNAFLKLVAAYRDPLRPAAGLTRRKIIKTGAVVMRVTCQKGRDSISTETLKEILEARAAGF